MFRASLSLAVSAFLFLCINASMDPNRKIYHVKTHANVIDKLLEIHPEVDVWQREILNYTSQDSMGPLVDLTLYTTENVMAMLEPKIKTKSNLFSILPSHLTVLDEIKKEKKNLKACKIRTQGYQLHAEVMNLCENEFFGCFRTHVEVFEFLDLMIKKYPNSLEKFNISKTYEGRTIYGYKLARDLKEKSSKPAIYVQGLLHAREWLAVPTIVYTMSNLLDGIHNKEPAIEKYVDTFDWYFVPLVNIDGYEFSWTTDRLWRKNRKLFHSNKTRLRGGERGNVYGVDLNRNYGPQELFCKHGASTSPMSQSYCGEKAFSESEIEGINTWLKEHPEIVGGIDVHCYGSLVLRPYAMQYETVEEQDNVKMTDIGDAIARVVNAEYKQNYRSMQASQLYTASGTFMDNMYESFGHRPSITFELRGKTFIVNEENILLAGKEIYNGLMLFADSVKQY